MSAAPTDADLVAKYISYRDFVAKEQEALNAKLKPYNEAITMIAGAMQIRMKEAGAESIRTEFGTAYVSTTTQFKVVNRDDFFNFIREADAFELLTAAVAKDAVKQYADEHQGQIPPGLEQSWFTKVNFRSG